MSNVAICHTSITLNIKLNNETDFKDTKKCMQSPPSVEVKFIFTNNPSQL